MRTHSLRKQCIFLFTATCILFLRATTRLVTPHDLSICCAAHVYPTRLRGHSPARRRLTPRRRSILQLPGLLAPVPRYIRHDLEGHKEGDKDPEGAKGGIARFECAKDELGASCRAHAPRRHAVLRRAPEALIAPLLPRRRLRRRRGGRDSSTKKVHSNYI